MDAPCMHAAETLYLPTRAKQLALALALVRGRKEPPPSLTPTHGIHALLSHLQQRIEKLQFSQPVDALPSTSLRMNSSVLRWLESSHSEDLDVMISNGIQLIQTALQADQTHWEDSPEEASSLVCHVLNRMVQAEGGGKTHASLVVEFAKDLCQKSSSASHHDKPSSLLGATQALLEIMAQHYGSPVLVAFAQSVRRLVEDASDFSHQSEHIFLSAQPVFGAFQHVLENRAHAKPVHNPDEVEARGRLTTEWMNTLQEALDASWNLPGGCSLLKLSVWHLSMLANSPLTCVSGLRQSPPGELACPEELTQAASQLPNEKSGGTAQQLARRMAPMNFHPERSNALKARNSQQPWKRARIAQTCRQTKSC